MTLQRLLDFCLARIRIAVEQRLGRHHHAVAAIAALAGLLLDERTLQRVQLVERAEAFDGSEPPRDRRHRGYARAYALAADQHGAGAALRKPATEFGPIEPDVVAQNV